MNIFGYRRALLISTCLNFIVNKFLMLNFVVWKMCRDRHLMIVMGIGYLVNLQPA